ncbi:unnamed protein product [Effrenium voratum]|uniref:Protein kinase domain-containing protein n=1 Tax=Effrenium voratum TaxID=2562239 RepID=A0AA36MPS7_9DINO|nr:unnamed protein product [Effrenium voratum]
MAKTAEESGASCDEAEVVWSSATEVERRSDRQFQRLVRSLESRPVMDVAVSRSAEVHAFLALVCCMLYLYYCSLASPHSEETMHRAWMDQLRRSLPHLVALYLCVGMLAFPSGPFVRPHPAFWRAMFGLSLLYLLTLCCLLFLSAEEIRQLLHRFDPTLGVSSKLPDYATPEMCVLNAANLWGKMDIFIPAHAIGWMIKGLLVRDRFLLWTMSVGWELLEIALIYAVPNFNECWWDQWILDVLVCNAVGIELGMYICRYLRIKEYRWSGIMSLPTLRSKIMMLSQYQGALQWEDSSTIARCLRAHAMLLVTSLIDLNGFILKLNLWIPTEHPGNVWRPFFLIALAFPAMRQFYLYSVDRDRAGAARHRFGSQITVFIAIALTEVALWLKTLPPDLPKAPLPNKVACGAFLLAYCLFLGAMMLRMAPEPPERKVSAEYDLFNQGSAVKYFEDLFYEPSPGQLKPSLNDSQLEEVEALRHQAYAHPVLALAGAQVLYMFAWFKSTGEILRENIVSAAELFERSIYVSDCRPQNAYEVWHDNACDIRWTHAILLYHWLAQTELSPQQQLYQQKSQELLEGIRSVKKYESARQVWASPAHVNFNSIIFAGRPSRPIWDTKELPLGTWLEENHPIFKAELEAILNEPNDIFGQLMQLDPSREHLATPGGWDTLRIVRYHHWYDVFCQVAPRTCELIKTRPEINDCKFMNVNYVRLNPGTHLKPHYGNGPRLSAHLSVLAPEPMKAGLTVADQRRLWVEGEAILFDDTYPHMVSHWGEKPRYVILVWFCHPCDTGNAYRVPGRPSAALDADDMALLGKKEAPERPGCEAESGRARPGAGRARRARRAAAPGAGPPGEGRPPGKRWPAGLAQRLARAAAGTLGGEGRPPAEPLGRCQLVGFWGSGEEITQDMRWDGTQYSCILEIPCNEDALFQVQTETGRLYPSLEGANPSLRHELLGPDLAHQDRAWFLGSASGAVLGAVLGAVRRAEVFVACPKGCAVALGWRIQGQKAEEDDFQALGAWRISGHLGRGKQGATVYTCRWPGCGLGGVAALKFPLEAEELELYARLVEVPGLPDLLDFGRVHFEGVRGVYMAMSKTEPCLDTLLRGQLHIQDSSQRVLGRLSWPVAAGLGRQLLQTLRQIHGKQILHCDLKPGNVLLKQEAPWAQLIDFGRAGYMGRTSFERGHGGMRDFMSIKAGLEGGPRTAADDVESLGWLLLRCLLGGFPWSAKVKANPNESWEEGGQRVARDKIRFLEEGTRVVPPEYRFCPAPLLAFLRRARKASGNNLADAEYEVLAGLLSDEDSTKKWETFVTSYYEARDAGILPKGMWPYAGVANLHWLFVADGAGLEPKRLRVQPGLLLRLTGQTVEKDECVWMEFDPVWVPGLASELLRPGWVLAVGPPPGGGRSESWLEWRLEFPVVENVKGVLTSAD